ncbi:hypothetical protein IT570_07755 [Candidatus Sumerlaeota bacterium]|nr:hypothetical protein [Candidatus Sumerlaeota bacterium]
MARLTNLHRSVGVFLLLFGFSLAFFRGSLETSDEQLMAATTGAIAERFSLTFTEKIHDQYFTGYGVGTPAAGVPMYFLERMARATSLWRDAGASLIPLTNSFLFALIGTMLSMLVAGAERWAFTAVLVLVSPLLPTSLTFYSEMLATFGIVGCVLTVTKSADAPDEKPLTPWWNIAAVLFAALAVLSRMAVLPLILLVAVWGWRLSARRETLASLLGGCAAALAITFIQNNSLRGSPLATGYNGQDFTTPLLTGLYGLLFSPERGILIFFPLILLPFVCWGVLSQRSRAMTILATAASLFWLVMHAMFWTWHGGWTIGPRFMIPCMALFVPPLCEVMMMRKKLRWHWRLALALGLTWCGLMSYIYCRHSAFAWWNQLWVLHGQENEWLFLPQLSLWQAWYDGVPLAGARAPVPRSGELVLSAICALCMIAGVVTVLSSLRAGDFVETGSSSPDSSDSLRERVHFRFDRGFIAVLCIIAGTILVYRLKGPRGFDALDARPGESSRVSHLLLENRTGRFEGYIDNKLATPIIFALKSNALYRVSVDDQLLIQQVEAVGYHRNSAELKVEPGRRYKLLVEVEQAPNQRESLFQLFWTWGGNGTYLAPVGGEYLLPHLPTSATETFFTLLWRRKFVAGAALLALLLLIKGVRPATPA